jgi:hypothetical protein
LFVHGAHVDTSPHTLREKGQRYNSENIIRGEKKGVRFHVPGWIRWVEKAEKLGFYYNDEDDLEIQYNLLKNWEPLFRNAKEHSSEVVQLAS